MGFCYKSEIFNLFYKKLSACHTTFAKDFSQINCFHAFFQVRCLVDRHRIYIFHTCIKLCYHICHPKYLFYTISLARTKYTQTKTFCQVYFYCSHPYSPQDSDEYSSISISIGTGFGSSV